jgi:cytochrome c oxidase subunit 2
MPESVQSVLDPHGPHAAVTAEIAWVLAVGAALVFTLVMALAAWAALGRRRGWLAGRGAMVGGGVVFPAVVLFALLVYTLLAAARIDAAQRTPAVAIEVVGEQWWWRVHYLDGAGEIDFATANEIRVPVGRTVELRLRSADVLHSFWVPALAGKLDLVPGRTNVLRLSAGRPGVFRGQCAEYCGGPHALMAFHVVAEEEEAFERWRARQRLPAAASNELFDARCAACHTVRGTAARGTLGPDLTHVGSRPTIAAGILPNNRGAIAGWIAEGQRIKPGNLMPEFREFRGDELTRLAAYVEGLQ